MMMMMMMTVMTVYFVLKIPSDRRNLSVAKTSNIAFLPKLFSLRFTHPPHGVQDFSKTIPSSVIAQVKKNHNIVIHVQIGSRCTEFAPQKPLLVGLQTDANTTNW